MTNELKDRIAKIYELIQRGSTPGERQAAKKALDRLMKKYDLDDIDMNELELRRYTFKYSWLLEIKLMNILIDHLVKPDYNLGGGYFRRKVVINLRYLDYITLDSSYEYFRRHMKSQWKKLCVPAVNRCRSAKTRRKKREELEPLFFDQYIIASDLIDERLLAYSDPAKMSVEELKRRLLLKGIEGGQYKKQVVGGHFLTQ